MPLTVLTDSDVRALLLSLTRDDICELSHNLVGALHEYSTGNQDDSGCCSAYQPQRTIISKKSGFTTLFMPATSSQMTGVKILSMMEAGSASRKLSKTDSLSSSSTKTSSISSATTQMSGMTLSPASTISSPSSVDGSSFQAPPSIASSQSTTPRGTVTLLDATGTPKALINAEELTAFRTALTAVSMMSKRQNVHTITVFGAGKQAYWHIRLALLLRGSDIHHVNIINRSFNRIGGLLKEFYELESSQLRTGTKFSALSSEFGEYGRLLKEHVRKADVIFCCTPSTEPLFPPEFLTSHEGRRKGRFISAIGSYKPHMIELHPEILKQACQPDHKHHHHKHARQGGVIIVDSLEGALKEAGEIIQAKLNAQQLVEIGELMMVKKASQREVELGGEGEKGLVEWLREGNVIFKSVGLGLMDVVVGGDIVQFAVERGIGTSIPDF